MIDEQDADQANDIDAMGLGTRVLDTIMRDVEVAAAVADAALSLADTLR